MIALAVAAALLAEPAPIHLTWGETTTSDEQWEAEDRAEGTTGPCSQLGRKNADLLGFVTRCHVHYFTTPLCVDYKQYAGIWYDMRVSNEPAWAVQDSMLETLGTSGADDEPQVYQVPWYRADLRRLLVVVQNLDRTKWKTSRQFAAHAYATCMSGHFF